MTHAFKEIRLTNSYLNATGGQLKVGNEEVLYKSHTGDVASKGYANDISGVLSDRLIQSGQGLLAQIASSSAGVDSVNGVTGEAVFVGTGGITVSVQGQNVVVSGSNTYQNFTTSIPTGIDSYFVPFTTNFLTAPKVLATVEVTGDIMYGVNVRNRTISGYTAIFSDTVYEDGVAVHTFASV